MLTTLIFTVLGVCSALVIVMLVMAAVEKRMEKENIRLTESFLSSIASDRRSRNKGQQMIVRMNEDTFKKIANLHGIIEEDGNETPLDFVALYRSNPIGRYLEYTIIGDPALEVGAFLFG